MRRITPFQPSSKSTQVKCIQLMIFSKPSALMLLSKHCVAWRLMNRFLTHWSALKCWHKSTVKSNSTILQWTKCTLYKKPSHPPSLLFSEKNCWRYNRSTFFFREKHLEKNHREGWETFAGTNQWRQDWSSLQRSTRKSIAAFPLSQENGQH